MAQLATICYLDNGRQFLMLYRNKKENDVHQGKWISVGGKFESGESPEACAIREIKEETGLDALTLDLQGVISFPDFQHDGRDWMTFVYRVTDFEGDLIEDCDEGDLRWVDYDQIMDLPTWEGDYLYLDWILKQAPFFSAQFIYDLQGQLIDHSVKFYSNSFKE